MENPSIIYEIEQLAIHKVGNKIEHEGLLISESTVSLTEEMNALLGAYFFTPFKGEEKYQFYHDAGLEYNDVYNWAKEIFTNPETLLPNSAVIAKHLYDNSGHPRVKGGEFYVAYFKDCAINGTYADAIGLFKSENKDIFLRVYPNGDQMELSTDNGININKLDKGCIIYNIEESTGYVCKVLDKSNKGNENIYWFDYFLHVRQITDNYFFTEQMIEICKEFVKTELPEEFEVSKADQADIFIKTEEYLKNKDEFKFEEFTEAILEQPEVRDKFADFRYNYQQERSIQLEDDFTISDAAVKKKKSFLRSKIKLDKNFTIYVHGNTEMITNEVDETGRKYYKLYYDNEQ